MLQIWKYISGPHPFYSPRNQEESLLSLQPHPYSCCEVKLPLLCPFPWLHFFAQSPKLILTYHYTFFPPIFLTTILWVRLGWAEQEWQAQSPSVSFLAEGYRGSLGLPNSTATSQSLHHSTVLKFRLDLVFMLLGSDFSGQLVFGIFISDYILIIQSSVSCDANGLCF